MPYRIEIDQDNCLSSGRCVAEAPLAFGFDDEQLAVVLDGATNLEEARALRIARACPNGAIHLFDADGSPVAL